MSTRPVFPEEIGKELKRIIAYGQKPDDAAEEKTAFEILLGLKYRVLRASMRGEPAAKVFAGREGQRLAPEMSGDELSLGQASVLDILWQAGFETFWEWEGGSGWCMYISISISIPKSATDSPA